MKIARVAGTVVSTICSPSLSRRKLLLCDLLSFELEPTGGYLIAIDTVGAGVGDTVVLLDEGTGARQVLADGKAPVRTVVVGIVDEVDGTGPFKS